MVPRASGLERVDCPGYPLRSSIRQPFRGGFSVANIKSQIKRNRQTIKATDRNKAVRSEFKTAIRKFREAAEAGNRDEAEALMRDASQQLDKATSKGVIHANQAANKKSRMAKRMAKV